MNVNGNEWFMDLSKPGWKRMYLSDEAKGVGQHRRNGVIYLHGGDQLLPTGMEVPLGAKRRAIGATGEGAVILYLVERVELQMVLHEDLGARKLSTSSRVALGGSRQAAYT